MLGRRRTSVVSRVRTGKVIAVVAGGGMVTIPRRALGRLNANTARVEFPRGTVLGPNHSLLNNASVNINAGGTGEKS